MSKAPGPPAEVSVSENIALLTADEREHIIRFQEEGLKAAVEGRDPRQSVDRLCLLAEQLVPNAVASVMLPDEDGALNVFAAPSMPSEAIARLNGLRPGPHAGSCGNALYRRKPVYVSDTLASEEWRDLRQFARDFNLMAGWSVPVPGDGDSIVGTFALSGFERRSPTAFHKRLLGAGASIIGLIVERRRQVEARRAGEEKFRTLIEGVPAELVVHVDGIVRFASHAFMSLFKLERAAEAIGRRMLDFVQPDFHDIVVERMREVETARRSVPAWNIMMRRADGSAFAAKMSGNVIEIDGEQAVLSIVHDITAHQAAKAVLREREELFRATFEQTAIGFTLVSFAGGIEAFNSRFCDIVGYPPEDVAGLGWRDITHPDDIAASEANMGRLVAGNGGTASFEKRYIRKDGRAVWVRLNTTLRRDESGRPIQFITAVEDIDREKAVEAKLRLAANVFAHTREGITITDARGRILDVNPAFTRLTGYGPDEVIGRNPSILQSGRHGREFYERMWASLLADGHWSGEIWNRRKSGETYPEWLDISAVRDDHGAVDHFVAVFHDISLLKNQQEALDHLAHHDALTGLPNRVLLADRMRQIIAEAARRPQTFALAYMDLDGFKPVNDQYGHAAGDALLVTVAGRIGASLRTGDTVARLGGDEFAILLRGPGGREEFEAILARIAAQVGEPVALPDGNPPVTVSASIGVALYPDDAADPDLLLRHADQAMYHVKQSDKGRTRFYEDCNAVSRQREKAVERLRQALENGEFELYYQPKVNMRTATVVGAEALIRWNHPEHGLLLPGQFLPDLFHSDLEPLLGEWVIETALAQMEEWRRRGINIPVSVNVAAPHLLGADFVGRLAALLSRHPEVPPRMLQLEVLESAALENLTEAAWTIEACRKLGVGFALDDFGTGYSSLAYLKALPAEALKVDRSFIADMLRAPGDLAIIGGVVGLAEAFGHHAVAEGVETAEQGRMLLKLGCDVAQGFGIARPMPAGELPAWMSAWEPDPSWTREQRLSADDFPLLLAEQRHRAWVERLVAVVSGNAAEPPFLNPSDCWLGRWIQGAGRSRYGEQPYFVRLEEEHRQIHDLAEKLVALVGLGQQDEAQRRLPDLLALQSAIIAAINRCMVGDRSFTAPGDPS